jgi:23S rRNA (guanosine2251-2'-O)-methyltransferase
VSGERPPRDRDERAPYEETILFGVHALATVLAHAPERVLRVLYSGPRLGARGAVLEAAEGAGVAVEQARDRQLDHLLPDEQHQGLLAFVRPAPLVEWHDLCALAAAPEAPLLVALDQVTDARNFGAILRSAEALGARGAVITSNRCARPGPIAARTSAGASELLPIAMVTNLSQALLEAKEAGFQVVGADMDGDPAYALDWAPPTVLVIGAEGKGLRHKTRATCDHVASIPLRGHTESLNASVAAGVLLYEASKARGGR